MSVEELDVYLVGGAVRDELLGLAVVERDWVVVGATIEQMLSLGFTQVGRDFPVFLHPQTHEEYALARTERKAGHGYTGFEVHAAPDVSLEQDLQRRDLTINAIAKDKAGTLIDPFGGQRDLAQRRLRHVSNAFQEDPLRVLRAARFAARFSALKFSITPATMSLMVSISQSGELGQLPAERLWIETEKALATQTPQVFFESLQECQALRAMLPNWSPSQQDLDKLGTSAVASNSLPVRYASLLASETLAVVTEVSATLKAPNNYRDLAQLSAREQANCAAERGADALALLGNTDAWRRPERFKNLLTVANVVGQLPSQNSARLRQALTLTSRVDTRNWLAQGIKGAAIGEHIQAHRLELLIELYGQ